MPFKIVRFNTLMLDAIFFSCVSSSEQCRLVKDLLLPKVFDKLRLTARDGHIEPVEIFAGLLN